MFTERIVISEILARNAFELWHFFGGLELAEF
jgi:hypothetical protein